MSQLVRRQIPIAIMVILGIVLFVDFFFKVPETYVAITDEIKSFNIVVAGFALGLGVFNILEIHGKHISKRTPEQWYYSVWLIIVMAAFIITGLGFGIQAESFKFLYQNFFMPLDMTIYSLIGWLVIYAIYIAFRARTVETLFMIVIFFFALMGNAPVGAAIWTGFPDIRVWMETVPNSAATRGYYLAQSIGAIAMGLRTLVGKTRAGLE